INGTPINNSNATLSWILPTKSTSTLKYEVQYSKKADFSDAVSLKNLDKPNVEVKNLDKDAVYYWRASSTTNSGLTSNYSAPTSFSTGSTVTAIENKEVLPTQFELSQNYPNPFNPTTVISYQLPANSFVTLKVYDMLGREVKTLVSQETAAGKYSVDWNGDDSYGNKVATGAYVYRIIAGDFISVKKMLLIK
ncbi:MAG: FlgD immunoglobulin-like domain containing protein, partial [Ignavibacteria bacterium]|nr:FlgD immunoglobulin-like domain containing protein [Ignavibacteria bacterium]